jgi:hypothetical protein
VRKAEILQPELNCEPSEYFDCCLSVLEVGNRTSVQEQNVG